MCGFWTDTARNTARGACFGPVDNYIIFDDFCSTKAIAQRLRAPAAPRSQAIPFEAAQN
jgi:hypothetical protein